MARARGAGLEDLLAQSDWLGRLAHRLASPADADDAVQDTWLAAQRAPPDPARPPRPWLAEVLRNLLRARWHADQRRRRREQTHATLTPDREAAVDAVYERVEMQRLVAERVMALEEPIRIVLLLRYFEGHDSTRIGQLLGIPPGTVRWRLKQALDRLRADMDSRFHGDRRAWAVVLAPGADGLSPAAPAATVAPAALLAGGLALLAGAVLGVGLGAWSGTAARVGAPPPSERWVASLLDGRPEASARRWARVPRLSTPPHDTDDTRAAALEAAARRGPRVLPRPLAGSALDPCAPDGTAAVTGAVRLRGRPEDDAIVVANRLAPAPVDPAPPAKARSTDGGHFCFPTLPPGRYVLTASGHDEGSNHAPEIELRADQVVRDLVIDLQSARAGVFGRVLDSDGGALARARVRARTAGGAARAPLAFEAESGCLGRYRMQLPPGLYRLEIEAAGYAPTRFSLLVRAPAVRDVRLFPDPPAPASPAAPLETP
jgi:RNA polymerase sigma-70 factor, ECF subfamily